MADKFQNRVEAGRALAEKLKGYANLSEVVVLALPRGGVPVAFEVAKTLNAPLDIFVVRKLGLPGQEELAMGAIASGGVRVLNQQLVNYLNIPEELIDRVAAQEQQELERREQLYRNHRPALEVDGRTVILVDDGLATGSTMRAAVEALRQLAPARIIIAVPVSPPNVCREFSRIADECICALTPQFFGGVGKWYRDFSQTTDEEVRDLLERARRKQQTA
ncbi:MAG: phosphoribosyltransferase [Acidobacteriota bacterium]